MPAAPKGKPFVVALDVKTPQWKVVEALRNKFVIAVTTDDGTPKLTKAGTQQVRRAAADEIVRKGLAIVLLNASPETLSALASPAQDKMTTAGNAPKFKTSEFIENVVACRDVRKSAVDASQLLDEKLLAEIKRREVVKKAGKGTKVVPAF